MQLQQSQQQNSMGNSSGVIQNQSDFQLIYTIHRTQMIDTEQLYKRGMGIEVNGNAQQGQKVESHANSTQEKEKVGETIKNIYRVKPGRTTTVGLVKVDFDQFKFITIIAADKHQTIIASAKIAGYEDLMLKIREDLSVKIISQNQANLLKIMSEGNIKGEEGACVVCKEKSKCELLKYFNPLECRGCLKENQLLWVCQVYPIRHCLCEDCYTNKIGPKKMGV